MLEFHSARASLVRILAAFPNILDEPERLLNALYDCFQEDEVPLLTAGYDCFIILSAPPKRLGGIARKISRAAKTCEEEGRLCAAIWASALYPAEFPEGEEPAKRQHAAPLWTAVLAVCCAYAVLLCFLGLAAYRTFAAVLPGGGGGPGIVVAAFAALSFAAAFLLLGEDWLWKRLAWAAAYLVGSTLLMLAFACVCARIFSAFSIGEDAVFWCMLAYAALYVPWMALPAIYYRRRDLRYLLTMSPALPLLLLFLQAAGLYAAGIAHPAAWYLACAAALAVFVTGLFCMLPRCRESLGRFLALPLLLFLVSLPIYSGLVALFSLAFREELELLSAVIALLILSVLQIAASKLVKKWTY